MGGQENKDVREMRTGRMFDSRHHRRRKWKMNGDGGGEGTTE